ncbi:uncharacterized protein LOC142488853 [Ascaphus truei]|uniref:uncharacterized protein LOC142488853 n=1 Tax=Ascaphus truei TaxID=8439 RepID=UPI003F5A70A1
MRQQKRCRLQSHQGQIIWHCLSNRQGQLIQPIRKLTNVWSSKQLSFLDVLISQENGEFHTDLYRKDTDRNALLRADSHHPPSLINALPFSQKVRVSRITIRQDKLAPAMDDLRERFTKRGYTPAVLDAALNREVIPNRVTKDEKRIVFSTTYNRASNLVRFTIRKHWHLLQNDEVLAASCQTPPLIAYRRGRNLSDNLIHADNKDHYHTPHFLEGGKQGNFRCMNCSVCNSLTTGDVFCHPHSGKKITIHNRITCRSTFVVYIIRCPCGLVYVGKTTRMLKVRYIEHKSVIRKGTDPTVLVQHCVEHRHNVSSLRVMGIEHIAPRQGYPDRETLLLRREAYWIHTLQTSNGRGLNEQQNFKCFLNRR